MHSPKKLTPILKTPLSWIWLTSLGRCSIYVFPTFFHTRHQNCRTGFAEYLHKSTNHLYAIIHTSPKSSHSGIQYEKKLVHILKGPAEWRNFFKHCWFESLNRDKTWKNLASLFNYFSIFVSLFLTKNGVWDVMP